RGRGGLAAAHRDRLHAAGDRRGGTAHDAARNRTAGTPQGEGRGVEGTPYGTRARTGGPPREVHGHEGAVEGGEGKPGQGGRAEAAARTGATGSRAGPAPR